MQVLVIRGLQASILGRLKRRRVQLACGIVGATSIARRYGIVLMFPIKFRLVHASRRDDFRTYRASCRYRGGAKTRVSRVLNAPMHDGSLTVVSIGI